jgi:methanogenic corrinoid protein MtbC1
LEPDLWYLPDAAAALLATGWLVTMSRYTDFMAGVLDSSASAYAAYAATRLLEKRPDVETRFAPDAFGSWRSNLTRCVQDLAIAVELDSPGTFAATVDWSRIAFKARELDEEDLRTSLVCLQEVLAGELPDGASSRVDRCFESAFARLDQTNGETPALDPKKTLDRLCLSYLQACLEGDAQKATQEIMQAVDNGLPVRQAYLQVVARAQEEVGNLWHAGKITPYEEHFVTATSGRVLALLAQRMEPAPANGRTVIGATIHENAHEFGIRTIMDLFGAAGWKTICLGASLPAEELAAATEGFGADLLILSVTLVPQLKHLRETIEAVRRVSPGIKVLVGGLALQAAPDAWKWAGADAFARSPDEALEVASRLLGSA